MKILIAQMEHETNTFSPVPTPWESFGPGGAYLGDDAYRAMKGTRTPIGAFIDLAEKEHAEIVTPVAGFAYPSGPVDPAAYETTQVFFKSKDGTQVPMFISHKKGMELDGNNPTICTATAASTYP